jgi:periplasmic protein TonB
MTDGGMVGYEDRGATFAAAQRRIRAIGFVVVASLHVGLFLVVRAEPPDMNRITPIEIEIVPRGDAVADRTASEASLAAAAPMEQESPSANEAPPEDKTVELAAIETSAPPITAIPIKEDLSPPEAPAPSAIARVERQSEAGPEPQVRPEREPAKRTVKHPKPKTKRKSAAKQASDMPSIAAENRAAGTTDGREDLRAARASYAALVSAEINRHKFYPVAARDRGETGSVVMALVVGPAGSIVSHALRRSSGSTALDAAAVVMLEASRAPPPPGGRYSGSIHINFAIGR